MPHKKRSTGHDKNLVFMDRDIPGLASHAGRTEVRMAMRSAIIAVVIISGIVGFIGGRWSADTSCDCGESRVVVGEPPEGSDCHCKLDLTPAACKAVVQECRKTRDRIDTQNSL